MELKGVIILLLLEAIFTIVNSRMAVNNSLSNLQKSHPIKSIKSEDGDIIDCIDIYQQPAFGHPSLKDHKIQLNPSYNVKMETSIDSASTVTTQRWRRSGSCPKGTVPVRRMQENNVSEWGFSDYGRKKPMFLDYEKQFNNSKMLYLLRKNHSLAMLHTEGYAYFGGKGDIKVWNPQVESDDEYSTSRVTLINDDEAIESGWAVNPRVYGDRQTRLFVYWTVDASKKTGCFDLTCPGFVQTSHEIALGAAIYPISNPTGLPYQITIYIHKDPNTSNWWVTYGESLNIGYWPSNLFTVLKFHAVTVQWGGEVYSSRVGSHPHTATAMGNGRFPDYVMGNSGSVKRMRILGNNMVLSFPQWVYSYSDEYDCYGVRFVSDYVADPEFYYGGPGRNPLCP